MPQNTKTKIIQVPVSTHLLERLDLASESRDESRSAFIREACELLLKQLEDERLDREYEEAYRKLPETAEDDEWRMKVLQEVWGEEEDWEGW